VTLDGPLLWLIYALVIITGSVWTVDVLLLRHVRVAAGADPGPEPGFVTGARWLFIIGLFPAAFGMFRGFDFELAMVVASTVTGVVWLLDRRLFAPRRLAAGAGPAEPTLVEYCRSFFPIILLVLFVRSFLYEPFRIPSSSMVPTLLIGDFIFVNKYTYGLRLPVTKSKIVQLGEPERGDVVVFRLPSDPKTNFIKRVVGLPGDVVRYANKQLSINGKSMPLTMESVYDGAGPEGARLARERLDDTEHEVLLYPGRFGREGEFRVPKGHYFLMGDNRDNSRDSRYDGVGFVPEENLVGRAVAIWLNWNLAGSGPDWTRIGNRIN
jgi:signal peptidase I